jgi:hypothetical protein
LRILGLFKGYFWAFAHAAGTLMPATPAKFVCEPSTSSTVQTASPVELVF